VVLSLYNGYFGAGAGVMILTLLLVLVDGDLPTANALKNMLLGAAAVVSAAIFVVFGAIDWSAAIPLALGMLAGSRVGPVVARPRRSTALADRLARHGLIDLPLASPQPLTRHATNSYTSAFNLASTPDSEPRKIGRLDCRAQRRADCCCSSSSTRSGSRRFALGSATKEKASAPSTGVTMPEGRRYVDRGRPICVG
jgi:hypothetical protein